MQPDKDEDDRPPAEVQSTGADNETQYQSQYDGYELTAPEEPGMGQEQPVPSGQQLIEWEASEYVHHEKDISWFVLLGIGAVILLGLALIFKQWTFALLIVVMVVTLILFARRPPRVIRYALIAGGIRIDDRLYPYGDFRAFGVMNEGPLFSIVLIPNKRFMPATSMFFEEKDGEQIVDILAARLPMQQVKPDYIDALTRKLRF